MVLHPASVNASKDLMIFMECLLHLLCCGCLIINVPWQPGGFAEGPEMKSVMALFS